MSDTNRKSQKQLIVYALHEYQRDGQHKTQWIRIGRAFKNRDGSLQVRIACAPLSGNMQIRPEEPKPQDTTDEEIGGEW